MAEVLVDKATSLIKSIHQFPLNFSISGKYVINIPQEFEVSVANSNITDLITAKIKGFKSLHPTLSVSLNDELITSPNVDLTQSTKITFGDSKRTSIFPGGSLVTNLFTIPTSTTKVCAYWNGYSLFSRSPVTSNPGPNELLHSFDPTTGLFIPFDPTLFTVSVRNNTNTVTIANLPFEAEQSLVLTPGSYRLRFTNTSPSTTYILSSWIVLHD